MKNLFIGFLFLCVSILLPSSISAATYYLSPTGNDALAGTTQATAWKNFTKAWAVLQAGDTLLLLDGTYYEMIKPTKSGNAGSPITIKALNPGKAIIDGNYDHIPIWLDAKHYFVFEDLIVQHSGRTAPGNQDLIRLVNADNNIFRRIHARWGDPDIYVYGMGVAIGSEYNVFEDIVVSGVHTKSGVALMSSNNTFRRVFSNWERYDSREDHNLWPWGYNFHIYIGDNNKIENCIMTGPSNVGIDITDLSSDPANSASNNEVNGCMAFNVGMHKGEMPFVWGTMRPQHSLSALPTAIFERNWIRSSGYSVGSANGTENNNILRDIVSLNNAGYGIYADNMEAGNTVDHATIVSNSLDNMWGGNFNNVRSTHYDSFSITNSNIEGTPYTSGPGARVQNRYVDGVLTNQSLWPWPMEDRMLAELGFSPTDYAARMLKAAGITINTGLTGNRPPFVQAGPDYYLNPPSVTIPLRARAIDDGLSGQPLTYTWSQVDEHIPPKYKGTGTATIQNPSSPTTQATISAPGHYMFRITVSDGEYTAWDEVYVQIFPTGTSPGNQGPRVDAGDDKAVAGVGAPLAVSGWAWDHESQPLTYSWIKRKGPGTVTFSSPTQLTTNATFSSGGTYILRLTASDGDSTRKGFDEITVTVGGEIIPTSTTDPTQPTPTPTRAPTTAVTPITLPGAGIISSFTVASSKTYQAVADGLVENAPLYTDRSYTFSSPIPSSVSAATYIKTANDDRGVTNSSFLTLNLSSPATVYVVYDSRATSLPTWLLSWSDTGETILTTDGGTTRKLYSKSVSSGTITLGGNENGTTGAGSMYSVIVVPSGDSPGDTDSDGDVDIFDYNAVLSNFGAVTGASRSGGDLDGDGDVDIFDYNLVISNFGR